MKIFLFIQFWEKGKRKIENLKVEGILRWWKSAGLVFPFKMIVCWCILELEAFSFRTISASRGTSLTSSQWWEASSTWPSWSRLVFSNYFGRRASSNCFAEVSVSEFSSTPLSSLSRWSSHMIWMMLQRDISSDRHYPMCVSSWVSSSSSTP